MNMNSKRREGNESAKMKGAGALLKEKLDLSDDQLHQMMIIRNDFLKREEEIDLHTRPFRDTLNLLMFNEQKDTVNIKRMANQISKFQYEIEMLRTEQADAFKKICTPAQRAEFRKIVFDIRDYFKREGKRR